MQWDELPDTSPRCDGGLGPPDGSELVARLLTDRNSVPEAMILQRASLMKPSGGFSNECGKSSGLSVDRCTDLGDQQIRFHARAYAQQKSGRETRGAWIACVQALRDIRLEDYSGEQLIRVYEDPSEENRRHSVIRVLASITRTRFSELRAKMETCFSLRLTPDL